MTTRTAAKLAIFLAPFITGAGTFVAITQHGPIASVICGAAFFVSAWCAIDTVLEGV